MTITERAWYRNQCPRWLAVLLMLTMVPSVMAQTFSVVYSFGAKGGGAADPWAGVIRDGKGNFYGTSAGGGAFGYGAVFKVNASGTETVLHSFAGGDGYRPEAPMLRDTQNKTLYATTLEGGTPEGGGCRFGCGTLFKIDDTGKESLLYAFKGGDGANPSGALARDGKNDIYGTTQTTAFKVDPSGAETVLHRFTGGVDGTGPSGLVRDSAGNLYGTTESGGQSPCGCGSIFQISKAGQKTLLYSFSGADGSGPKAAVILDGAGNLYGTTTMGGASNEGVVFKLDSGGKLIVLHSFAGGDGAYPVTGLVRDAAGNLYGTTNAGGTHGDGTIFRLDSGGNETVLYSFAAGVDGSRPSGLIQDSASNLYGTTQNGGKYKRGNIFKLTP